MTLQPGYIALILAIIVCMALVLANAAVITLWMVLKQWKIKGLYSVKKYNQVGLFCSPPAACDLDIFHYIYITYIHNMHTIEALIVNRAV